MSSITKVLQRLLPTHAEFRLAILFGSQAAGTATARSDIDLALLADAPIGGDLKLALMEDIGAKLGCPVDIIDLYTSPEPVLGEVLKGKRILGTDSTYATLLTKHLHNMADFVPLQQRILAERRAAWIL